MKKYNVYAINRETKEEILLNEGETVSEKDLDRAISFYLSRGEWLERGYFVSEREA